MGGQTCRSLLGRVVVVAGVLAVGSCSSEVAGPAEAPATDQTGSGTVAGHVETTDQATSTPGSIEELAGQPTDPAAPSGSGPELAADGTIGPVPDVDALFSAVIDVLPPCSRGEADPSTPSGTPGSSVRCVVEGTPGEELLFVVSDDVERELAAIEGISAACEERFVVRGGTWLIVGLHEPDVPSVIERTGGAATPLECRYP